MFDLLVTLLKQVRRDPRAVTAMEYGLIASLIAVVIIVILGTVGKNLTAMFTKISTSI